MYHNCVRVINRDNIYMYYISPELMQRSNTLITSSNDLPDVPSKCVHETTLSVLVYSDYFWEQFYIIEWKNERKHWNIELQSEE